MTVLISFIPSVSSDAQGIQAAFDGERVSYNGDFFTDKIRNVQYRAYDGYGVVCDNDFKWTGQIKVGTKVYPYCQKRVRKVVGVRVRVISQEATWDESGFTSSVPEITFDGEKWEAAYGVVPVEMKKAEKRFLHDRDVRNLKVRVAQRIKNGYKSTRQEIIAECKTCKNIPLKEAVKIGLAILCQ